MQATMLIERLTNAHAFVDANKRTAWVCCVTYLELNGFVITRIEDADVVDFMVSIANNAISFEGIARWLATRFA